MKTFIIKLYHHCFNLITLLFEAQHGTASYFATLQSRCASFLFLLFQSILLQSILFVSEVVQPQKLYSQSLSQQQWQSVGGSIDGGVIHSLALAKGVALASTPNGLFRSTDEGRTWDEAHGGLPSFDNNPLRIFVTLSGAVLAGTPRGMYRSLDAGQTWMPVTAGLPDANATLVYRNNNIYSANYILGIGGVETFLVAATREGVYRSEDDGQSWVRAGEAFPDPYGMFRAVSGTLYYCSTLGLYFSNDKGKTWDVLPINGEKQAWITAMSATQSTLYLQVNEPEPNRFWRVNNGGKVAERYIAPLQRSTNLGASTINVGFNDIIEVNGALVANRFEVGGNNTTSIIRSDDGGATWSGSAVGIPGNAPMAPSGTPAFVRIGNTLLCAPAIGGVYRSSDGGKTWSASHRGITGHLIDCLAAKGSLLLAGARARLFRSEDAGASWQAVLDTIMIVPTLFGGSIQVTDFSSIVFASGTTAFMLAFNGGLLRSLDNGRTWQRTALTESALNKLAVQGANIYVAGNPNRGLWRSQDNGATWTSYSLGAVFNTLISSLSASGNYVYITGNRTLLRSSDNGATWKTLPTSNLGGVGVVHANGSTVLLSTSNGIYRSTDNGETWAEANTGLPDESEIYNPLEFGYSAFPGIPAFKLRGVSGFTQAGANIFANTFGGVYVSNDDGKTWSPVKKVADKSKLYAFLGNTADNGTFAAIGGKVYKVSSGEAPTTPIRSGGNTTNGAHGNALHIAPNPISSANGEASVSYYLPRAGNVRIDIYNAVGQRAGTLFEGVQQEGEQEYRFAVGAYPPGVYMLIMELPGRGREREKLVIAP